MDVQSYAGLKLKIPANLNMRRSRACNGANFFLQKTSIFQMIRLEGSDSWHDEHE